MSTLNYQSMPNSYDTFQAGSTPRPGYTTIPNAFDNFQPSVSGSSALGGRGALALDRLPPDPMAQYAGAYGQGYGMNPINPAAPAVQAPPPAAPLSVTAGAGFTPIPTSAVTNASNNGMGSFDD